MLSPARTRCGRPATAFCQNLVARAVKGHTELRHKSFLVEPRSSQHSGVFRSSRVPELWHPRIRTETRCQLQQNACSSTQVASGRLGSHDAQPVKASEVARRPYSPVSAVDVEDYSPPTSGLLARLPASWIPYAELARLEKPTGALYLFFPCLFSTIMASTYVEASLSSMASTIILFGAGALVMRGAGCTVNDLWDRNLDPQVARTRLRPLARRAVRPQAALVFAGAQCLAGLAILLQFPQPACFLWGAPSLLLVGLYPLAKRVTHYPQFVLGLTFSWGALMGFPALGVDLAADHVAARAAACLYASCVSWTVVYDMIYAHMDLKDDRRAGIKSIALRHEQHTKQVLTGLATVQVGLLAVAGSILEFGPAFFIGSCGGSLCTLLLMIWKVKLEDARNCWWWFRYGAWLTGGTLSLGLFGEYFSPPTTHRRT